MLIGYARVSTEDQKLDLQHDALRTAGWGKVFDDKTAGAGVRLPVRTALLEYAREVTSSSSGNSTGSVDRSRT